VKIYYVVQRYGREIVGGAEAACRQLAQGMARKGDVTVLTTCATESTTWANSLPPGEEVENGVRIIRFPTVATRYPRFERMSDKLFGRADPPRRLQEKWVRAQGPDAPALIEDIRQRADEPDLWVFYTYLYYPTIFGLPLVASKAVLHPALHDEPPARLPIVRDVLRAAAGLSLQTHEEWEFVVRLAGWPPSKVRLVGMGVEDGRGDVEKFRSQYGLGSGPYALCLGRVDRGKGTDELAHAFIRFKQTHPGPLRLVIAGPVIHPPPQHEDVIVPGRLDDDSRWAALEGCDVYINPAPHESFGIALLEAWTKSKPALVNARSPVTSGHALRAKAGLAYTDYVEFEAALETLMADPEAARRLGTNGRTYAEQFSWERVLERYQSFLEDMADSVSLRNIH